MINALFIDPLKRGVRAGWTYMISRITMIILIAATCARAGDVGRSQMYTGKEFTAWKNAKIKIPNDQISRFAPHDQHV